MTKAMLVEQSRRLIDTDPHANIPLSMPIQMGLEAALELGDYNAFTNGIEALHDLEAQFYPQRRLIERYLSFEALTLMGEEVFSKLQESTTSVSGTRTIYDSQVVTTMSV